MKLGAPLLLMLSDKNPNTIFLQRMEPLKHSSESPEPCFVRGMGTANFGPKALEPETPLKKHSLAGLDSREKGFIQSGRV